MFTPTLIQAAPSAPLLGVRRRAPHPILAL